VPCCYDSAEGRRGGEACGGGLGVEQAVGLEVTCSGGMGEEAGGGLGEGGLAAVDLAEQRVELAQSRSI
jgi:hypothetical protein